MASSDEFPSKDALKSSADWIRDFWDQWHSQPGGLERYNELLRWAVPYTSTIYPEVALLERGRARVHMPARPELLNHLGSVHAIALCNLAELTANLALAYSLPPRSRFIVTELGIRYLKKAHGQIVGTCECPVPSDNERQEFLLRVSLSNSDGEVVAEATLKSLVGPAKSE